MEPIKILFFTDNFPPESNAPANRTYEHCIEWIKLGAEVTVITCNPNFPKGKVFDGYKNKLYSHELMDGIKVIRVWSYITKNRGTIRRILDYLSFALTSFIASLFHKTDIIIATSPQLFTTLGGYTSAIVKKRPWIMEVRDLWPESIKAVDAMSSRGILDRLQVLVDFLYRKADNLIVVTDSFKEQLSKIEGVEIDNIHVIKNGVNRSRFYPKRRNQHLRSTLQLQDKFIVGYVGTHGMAHNLDFIMDCAKQIEDPEVHFLFIGDGALKGRLLKKKSDEKLDNITMLEPVNRNDVNEYLSIIDASLIPLKKSMTFQSVIPSKIFENAAMGKPILLGVEGEARKMVSDYEAGLCFEPENELDFINKLNALKTDQNLYQKLSVGGISLAEDFNREALAKRMFNHINELHQKRIKFLAKKYAARDEKTFERRKAIVRIMDIILVLIIMFILLMMVS